MNYELYNGLPVLAFHRQTAAYGFGTLPHRAPPYTSAARLARLAVVGYGQGYGVTVAA